MKSEKGLWVKSLREGNDVAVYVQPCTRVRDGQFERLDANGEVKSAVSVKLMSYDSPWELCGKIPIEDSWLKYCPLLDFDKFVYGIERHVAHLIALGFGDTPEEVVGWFSELSEAEFVMEADYEVVGPEYGALAGMRGHWMDVFEVAEGLIVGEIEGFGSKYPFRYTIEEFLAPFVIATIPH